ncbi:HK97 family phage prohead protease [Corynebacterium glaucum]|uniref:HK97 family phage prohead protease n=1 Tax=Corynebacterium glaucum TaxID=187491 RepID=UPI002658E582|nr:HK97 family phage prohead protease [Corynebacterium glaucum]
MNLTRKISKLSVKSADDGSREITGYASTFGTVDAYGDTITPGAFSETIQEHLISNKPVPILFEHNRDAAGHVGEVKEMREDDHGLFIRAVLDDTPEGLKAYRLVKSRRINGLSIGFYPIEVSPSEVDGQAVNAISKLTLAEVSLVLNPANADALITSVKSSHLAATAAREVLIPSAHLAELNKSFDKTGDLKDLTNTLDRQRQLLASRSAADAYRDALLNDGDVYSTGAGNLSPEERSRVEADAVRTIMATAGAKAAGLTREDADRIERVEAMPTKWERFNEPGITELLKYDRPLSEPGEHYSGEPSLGPSPTERTSTLLNTLPVNKSTAPRLAYEAARTIEKKSLVGAPSAELYIPTEVSGIVTEGRPAHNLLELIPGKLVRNGASLTYFRQTERDLRADVVAVGENKPESRLGFERVDAALEVVAHVVRGIDKYVVQDLEALRNLIGMEMIAGVADKVERWTVLELLSADGHQVEQFRGDPFTTARLGVSRLQTIGLEANAIVLNPTTWAEIETTRADGDGQFVFNGAPVNQEQRLLWGVPVVTSVAIPEGNGLAVDLGSVDVFHDGRIEVAWHVSGEEFSRNQLSVRAEGRFRPVVTRSPGVVELLLTADAQPTPTPAAAPTADSGDETGSMVV